MDGWRELGAALGNADASELLRRTPWSWLMDATLSNCCAAPDVTRPAKLAVRILHWRLPAHTPKYRESTDPDCWSLLMTPFAARIARPFPPKLIQTPPPRVRLSGCRACADSFPVFRQTRNCATRRYHNGHHRGGMLGRCDGTPEVSGPDTMDIVLQFRQDWRLSRIHPSLFLGYCTIYGYLGPEVTHLDA